MACQKGPAVRFAEPEQILDRVYERTSCSRGVVGDAQVEVAGPFAHYKGKLLFKAEAPDHLRFDLYNDFGLTLASLASNGRRLQLFDLSSQTFYEGKPSACSLARFTQVRVSPMALVELLRGRPPVLRHGPRNARLVWRGGWFGQGRYVLTVRGEDRSEEHISLTVPAEDWALPPSQQRVFVTRVRVRQGDALAYDVTLSDYRPEERASLEPTAQELEMGILAHSPTGPACDAELPHRLSFDVGHGGHELRMIAQDMAHNPPFFDQSYELFVPASASIVSGGCP